MADGNRRNRRTTREGPSTFGLMSDKDRHAYEEASLSKAFEGIDWRNVFGKIGQFFRTILAGLQPDKYNYPLEYYKLTGERLNPRTEIPGQSIRGPWERASSGASILVRPDGSIVNAATGERMTQGEAQAMEENARVESMLESVRRLDAANRAAAAAEEQANSNTSTNADANTDTGRDTNTGTVARLTDEQVEALFAETKDFVRSREGSRTNEQGLHVVYADSLGKPTVGIGHLVLDADNLNIGDTITEARAVELFDSDARTAFDAAKGQIAEIQAANPGFVASPEFIKVLTSVNFQLGTNWTTEFTDTWDHIKNGRYEQAIQNLENSRWNTQTENRVDDFQNALRTQQGADARAVETAQTNTESPGGPSNAELASASGRREFERAARGTESPEAERELAAAARPDPSGPSTG